MAAADEDRLTMICSIQWLRLSPTKSIGDVTLTPFDTSLNSRTPRTKKAIFNATCDGIVVKDVLFNDVLIGSEQRQIDTMSNVLKV